MNNEELLDKIHDALEEVILDLSDRLDTKNKVIEDKLDRLIDVLTKLL